MSCLIFLMPCLMARSSGRSRTSPVARSMTWKIRPSASERSGRLEANSTKIASEFPVTAMTSRRPDSTFRARALPHSRSWVTERQNWPRLKSSRHSREAPSTRMRDRSGATSCHPRRRGGSSEDRASSHARPKDLSRAISALSVPGTSARTEAFPSSLMQSPAISSRTR